MQIYNLRYVIREMPSGTNFDASRNSFLDFGKQMILACSTVDWSKRFVKIVTTSSFLYISPYVSVLGAGNSLL